jgi:GTPase SAR1 family protein
MSEDFDLLFKVVLIGDCSVGKSWYENLNHNSKKILIYHLFNSIVTRFKTGNVFTERHTNTIGVDFSMKTIKIGNKKIKLQIWVRFFN